MLIFDENTRATILHNIATPSPVEYMWVLDLQMEDFCLASLDVLEETVSPAMQLMVGGFEFILPANWNILVCDDESMQLDVIELSAVAGKEFRAFVYGSNFSIPVTLPIYVTNYYPSWVNVGPALSKSQMLCHPIAPDTWVNVSPSDSYNKYLKGKVAGDII